MTEFKVFGDAVAAQFGEMSSGELFAIDIDRDDIWAAYLASFPAGSNPIFRERTEHDCSCCKHFVRSIGHVVAIQNGALTSVWDVSVPEPYAAVARALSELVKSRAIVSVFRRKEPTFGAAVTHELMDEHSHAWHHFHCALDGKHQDYDPASTTSRLTSAAHVFGRGLRELHTTAIETTLELIEQGNLYRGEASKSHLQTFLALKRAFDEIQDETAQSLFVWANFQDPCTRIRNTAIGTLLQDLSAGEDLEIAVRKYEAMVAPQNYRRPKALITENMVKSAMKTLHELGLEGAVKRRHARLSDVSVNDVLFVSNEAQPQMKDGIEGLLMEEVPQNSVNLNGATPISVEDFMKEIIPSTRSINVALTAENRGNFMSITAPEDEGANRLFNWGNDFAWSYDGDVADSIKDRVRAAGGKIDGDLRVSLAWFNTDDLDIHCVDPRGNHVHFGNKMGVLDVDMNVHGDRRDAVENLTWNNPADGIYKIAVNNYTFRETIDFGFELEVAAKNASAFYTFPSIVRGKVAALEITIRAGLVQDIKAMAGVTGGSRSIDKWGVKTEALVPVDAITLSPNHWGESGVGHKHWLFVLRGCKNPDPVRGIYNEFLRPELREHGKVFEVLGAKSKCAYADDQLSGVGFSGARSDKVKVVAKGPELNRAFEIQF